MSDSWREMGEGPIPAPEVEPEVRVIRHNVAALKTSVDGYADLVRIGISEAAAAKELAHRAADKADLADYRLQRLSEDVNGRQDRVGDTGLVGSMDAVGKKLNRLLWTALAGLVAFAANLAYTLLNAKPR